jgi:LysR family transcriptional regulator, hydrogen peroxide-inducible genes activator
MNIRDLQYVVAVAELQHFGRAAERCHVSQPTLSTQIRKLEEYLGVSLFERSGRKVLVSGAGEQIVERARALIHDYEELQSVARRLKDPSAGQYRLGVFPTLAPYFLPRIVPAIHSAYPRVRLILVEEKTEVLLARLRRGQIDMALLALPVMGDDLHAMPLFDESFCLAVSERNPLARHASVSAAELESRSLLLLDEGHCLRDQALEFCKLNAVEESREFRATSLETLIQMVATDLGITLVPEMATREAPRNLRFIPFREPKPHRSIGLVWRQRASQQDFFEQLGELMKTRRDCG